VRNVSDGSTNALFRYDAFGEVQELDVSSATSTDTRHDRRYGALFTWRDEAGASVLSRQIPGPDGLIATRHGAGGPWVFEFGEARGTRFTTDETGTFVQDVVYSPYGEPSSTGAQPGSHTYSNMQWNGGDALAALGLSHLGARLYDPVIGRFLSRDPLLMPLTASTTNPYAFANNDPVNKSDPTGLQPPETASSGNGGDGLDPLDPRDVARLHLLPGIYAARGLYTALDSVGNAIGDTASSVAHFFGFGGNRAAPAAINPGPASSLMRVFDNPSPQFGPGHYPDDLVGGGGVIFDGSAESWETAKMQGTVAIGSLAFWSGTYALDAAYVWLFGTAAATRPDLVADAVAEINLAATRLSKLPVPQWPSMFKTVADFGRAVGWGGSSDAAREQIFNLLSEMLSRIGMTREIAMNSFEFYSNEVLRNPGNPSAPGRADLMLAILKMLGN
jgi:RHS repeat-associated protein